MSTRYVALPHPSDTPPLTMVSSGRTLTLPTLDDDSRKSPCPRRPLVHFLIPRTHSECTPYSSNTLRRVSSSSRRVQDQV